MAREQRSQRGVVGLGGLGSGVQVEFARAAGELREEAGDGRGGHASGFAQAEDAVGKLHAAFFQKRERGAAERLENPRHRGAWAGLADEAHGAKAVIERDGERAAEDRGMEVQVRVAVPISRRKSKRAETRKLRLDLAPERLAVAFPALLFGWLRAWRGGIGAALLVHAASNVYADILVRGWL